MMFLFRQQINRDRYNSPIRGDYRVNMQFSQGYFHSRAFEMCKYGQGHELSS